MFKNIFLNIPIRVILRGCLTSVFLVFCIALGYNQTISRYEYFFDTDPGFNNGTQASVDNNNSFVADLSAVSDGVHQLFVRVKDSNGAWSLLHAKSFIKLSGSGNTNTISRYEYFFDTDPGFNNGTQASVDNNNSFVADLRAVSDGVHQLFVRVKDSNGAWSLLHAKSFIKLSGSGNTNTISRYEYFFDTDPGFNNGTQASVDNNNSFVADLRAVSDGVHQSFVRVKDSNGAWSSLHAKSFIKLSGSGNTNTISRYEYFFDTDPGLNNGIETTVDNNNSFVADLSAVSDGVHQLFVRVKDSNGAWSLLHAKSFIKFNNNNTNLAYFEYFIDTDGGIGSGQSFTTDANGGAIIPLDNINEGVHQLFVRAKDELGRWSLTHQRTFIKSLQLEDSPIVSMEYFFDTDPGIGNGVGIEGFTNVAGQPIIHEFMPSIDNLSFGIHKIFVRVKNDKGRWSMLRSGEVNVVKKGVTVIVHGFSPTGFPNWELTMAEGILEKSKKANIFKNNPTTGLWQPFGNRNSNDPNDEIILLYDWADLSNNGLSSPNYAGNGYLEAAADNLFAMLNVSSLSFTPSLIVNINLLEIDRPLHFIAHSRGNPLSLQVFHRLSKYFPNKKIDQFTLLDPHPATTFGDVRSSESNSPPSLPCIQGSANNCALTGCNGVNDIAIQLPDNVKAADCYYRQDGTYEGISDRGAFDGIPVLGIGNFNRQLKNNLLDVPYGSPCYSLFGGAHSKVHSWYYGTVNNEGNTPPYDDCVIADNALGSLSPSNWYNSGVYENESIMAEGSRKRTGFNYSRIGGLGYPTVAASTANLGSMEAALIARTGSGLRPIFNGDFNYGDGKSGWVNNGGGESAYTFYDNVTGHQYGFLLQNGILRHSLFYFSPDVSANPTKDYTWMRFRMKTSSSSRNISVTFLSMSGIVQTKTGVIYPTSSAWSYVYCAIPNSLKRKIGTFEILNNDASINALFVDDFEFTNDIPTAGDYILNGENNKLQVKAKAFLQGTLNSTTFLMNDNLRLNYIPFLEPYTGMTGFTHVGGSGGEIVPPSTLSVTGNNAIVDWVFMELRSRNNPVTVVATRSALIQRDGDIVDVDGVSSVNFNISADYFYVTIRHRNHLGIMTESPVDLRNSLIFLNFTDGTTRPYGTNAMKDFGSGKLGLWAGNSINDGVLKYSGSGNDRFPILSRIGGTNVLNTVSGYFREDTNLDGIVKYSGSGNDRLIILQNIGNTNVLLTLTEQIPK